MSTKDLGAEKLKLADEHLRSCVKSLLDYISRYPDARFNIYSLVQQLAEKGIMIQSFQQQHAEFVENNKAESI